MDVLWLTLCCDEKYLSVGPPSLPLTKKTKATILLLWFTLILASYRSRTRITGPKRSEKSVARRGVVGVGRVLVMAAWRAQVTG